MITGYSGWIAGNFTIANSVTGQYEITITGESYSNASYTTVVSPVSSSFNCFTGFTDFTHMTLLPVQLFMTGGDPGETEP